jgi:hypothetical protein
MSDNTEAQVRIILRSIQIKDSHDLDGEGEFRFTSRVTTAGQAHEMTFPDKYWRISDHPLHNTVEKIDKVLFEGVPGDDLLFELSGEELDAIKPNDRLEDYRKEFTGDPSTWVGTHRPTDEGPDDAENLKDWRITYDVELA